MKAVVYDAPRSFTVRQVPVPEPGPGEVRVKVAQAGICGTDLHVHEGQFMAAFPLTPGHEVVGVADKLGDGVTGIRVGEQVAVNPNRTCGQCSYCREGRPLMCIDVFGLGTRRPGGFAEYVVAQAAEVFSVDGLHPDTAVFVEPASCAIHGVDVIDPSPGSTALVFGAGPTGLLLSQLIARGGAAHVTVADVVAFKLDTARALGLDATFLMTRDDLPGDVEKLRAASRNAEGYDLVVDATGNAKVCAVCVPLTRNGGTAVFYGVAGEEDLVPVSPYDVFRREITIKGSFAEVHSFPAAIAALSTGRVRTTNLITHRFGLEEYGQALDAMRHDRTAHKIVMVP